MSNFDQRLPDGWNVWSEDSNDESCQAANSDPRWLRELDQIAGTGPRKTRSIPIKLLAPMLLEAQRRNSAWLDDFADDMAVIDADLHEVLLAYQSLQRNPTDGDVSSPRKNAAA